MGFDIVNPTRGIDRAGKREHINAFSVLTRNQVVPLPNHVRGGQIANLLKTDGQDIWHRLLVVVAHKTCKSQSPSPSTRSSHTDRRNAGRFLLLRGNILRSVEYPCIENSRILLVQCSILVSIDIPRANGDTKFLLLSELLSNAKEFTQNNAIGCERNIPSDSSHQSNAENHTYI